MKTITSIFLGFILSSPLLASAYPYDPFDMYGMMGYGAGNFGLLAIMAWAVWIVVGILAIVWLWQHINKK